MATPGQPTSYKPANAVVVPLGMRHRLLLVDQDQDVGCHTLPSGERQRRSIEALDRKPKESGDGRRDVDQAGRAPRRS